MRHGFRGVAVIALAAVLLLAGTGLGAADSGGSTSAVRNETELTTATAGSARPRTAGLGTLGPGEEPTALLAETAAAEANVEVTQEFALTPDRAGHVAVVHRYTIPDRVVSLTAYIPANATVTSVSGFERENETRFVWDETTASPAIAYRLPVNRTLNTSGPEGAKGRYVYVDAGEWALFARPTALTEWGYIGDDRVGFERRMTTAGPGATGSTLVYLGENEIVRREAYGQTFELVVPARAELAASRTAILNALTNASNALRVGDRDDRVFVVAAPTGDVTWALRGLATGDSDAWVRDFERLNSAENVWLHEYVHTRQGYSLTRGTRWFDEASASYYAALLSLELGYVEFPEFKRRLEQGTVGYNETILSRPSTWQGHAPYDKGALVVGALDRRLRLKTDRESAFQDVFREINEQDDPVTLPQFLTLLERYGGTQLRRLGRNYTTTTARPEMWNASQHERAFGQLPARIGYRLPEISNESAYRVESAYRERGVGGENPIRLVTDETLVVDVLVSNAGGTEGRYNVSLEVNGTVVNREFGRIDGRTNRTVPLSHTFSTPGRFRISVDGENVTVVVERPAQAYVTDLRVSRSRVPQHGTVTAIATVSNDADRPASGVVVFTRDFEAVERRQVFLPANSTMVVSAGIQLNESGTVLIGAGQAEPVSVTVTEASIATPDESPTPTVPPPTPTLTSTPAPTPATPGTTGAGFGVAAALVALAFVVAAGRYRSGR